MNLRTNEKDFRKIVPLLFLIAAGVVIYPAMFVDGLFYGYGTYLMKGYMIIPCMLFLGSALTQKLSSTAKRCLLLSAAMVIWFVAAQANHFFSGMGNTCFGTFLVLYLLAFPYAAVMEDGRKATGLSWIGGFYVAYALVMVVLAGMLLLDMVPEALNASVKWEGARVSLISHPNGGGCIMMLGIGCSLYFMTRLKQKWAKCIVAALTVLEFVVLILTNSRTTVLLTSALVGGLVFFMIWNGSWKRFLAGLAAALAIIVVLFSLSGALFNFHSEAQLKKLLEDESKVHGSQIIRTDKETGKMTLSGKDGAQDSLMKDMGSLNGRTKIWKAAFTALQDNPDTMLWGTENIAAEISYRNSFSVVNAHNSWIQIWMQLGVPGFLLAMLYTLTALWNAWKLVWRKDADLSQKVVAMLVVCIMGAGFLEVYLFANDLVFSNFIFFLCTGYLIQWNAEAAAKA